MKNKVGITNLLVRLRVEQGVSHALVLSDAAFLTRYLQSLRLPPTLTDVPDFEEINLGWEKSLSLLGLALTLGLGLVAWSVCSDRAALSTLESSTAATFVRDTEYYPLESRPDLQSPAATVGGETLYFLSLKRALLDDVAMLEIGKDDSGEFRIYGHAEDKRRFVRVAPGSYLELTDNPPAP